MAEARPREARPTAPPIDNTALPFGSAASPSKAGLVDAPFAARATASRDARRTALEDDLCASLLTVLDAATRALARDPVELGLRRPASPGARLSPAAFALYDQLVAAMTASDAERVSALLDAATGWDPWRHAPGTAVIPLTELRHLAPFAPTLGWVPAGAAALPATAHAREAACVATIQADLAARSPELAGELAALISDLALCQGASFNGLAELRSFGLVILNVPRPHHDPQCYYLEHLIHAGALLTWQCQQAGGVRSTRADTETPAATLASPWDGRAQSLDELVFEAFWLARAVRAFRARPALVDNPALPFGSAASLGQAKLVDKRAVFERALAACVATLSGEARHALTPAGLHVVDAGAHALADLH